MITCLHGERRGDKNKTKASQSAKRSLSHEQLSRVIKREKIKTYVVGLTQKQRQKTEDYQNNGVYSWVLWCFKRGRGIWDILEKFSEPPKSKDQSMLIDLPVF